MKVKNTGNPVVHVVLECGPVNLAKGQSVDMPEWVYKTLSRIFPALVPVEETVVQAEPAPIQTTVKPATAEVKNVKGKKSRK